jgi:hypothetical protein
MRKQAIIFFAFIVIHWTPIIRAQTLDELNRPLLKKGQWDLALDYKNYGFEYFSIDVFQGDMTYFDSRVILFPRLAFGLAKNLLLTLNGAYQFPITFAAPQFDEWDYWREINTIRSLSAQLLFRPAPNMELSLFLLHGQAKEDTHYAYTLGIDGHETINSVDSILILRSTWLSAVDGESRPLRADLDGLQGPLLKKRRWRIEPEILVRSHEYEYHHRYDVLPDYGDKNSDSTDTRLRLPASYGVTDHLEAKADIYWQPSFRINESSRSSIWWDETEHYNESKISHLYFDYWGGRGSLVWRPNPQIEMNLAFSRNWLKTGREQYELEGEKTGKPEVWYDHIITQIDLATTWLSKPKRPGVPLVADLLGLYHPLLEKKQFKLDGRICYRSYREIDDSSDGRWNTDSWLLRIQSVYGLSNSLQVSAYYGVRLFKFWFSDFKYEKEHTLGMELKWRFKKRVEIYAGLNYKPMVYLDIYPPFMLGIQDHLGGSGYNDFLDINFGEAINIQMGIKVIL